MNTDYSSISAQLVAAAENVWLGNPARITIRIEASNEVKLAFERFGFTPEEIFITDSAIRHIKRKHGAKEIDRGQADIVPKDFKNLPMVLEGFDTIEKSGTDKLGNARFLVQKKIDNVIYVALVQRGTRKLEIKSMWKR